LKPRLAAKPCGKIERCGLCRVGCGVLVRMGGDEVCLYRGARLGPLGEKVNMHLVRPAFGALVAKMGEIDRGRGIAGLAKGKRRPDPILAAPDEDIVCPGQSRAAD